MSDCYRYWKLQNDTDNVPDEEGDFLALSADDVVLDGEEGHTCPVCDSPYHWNCEY